MELALVIASALGVSERYWYCARPVKGLPARGSSLDIHTMASAAASALHEAPSARAVSTYTGMGATIAVAASVVLPSSQLLLLLALLLLLLPLGLGWPCASSAAWQASNSHCRVGTGKAFKLGGIGQGSSADGNFVDARSATEVAGSRLLAFARAKPCTPC